MEIPLLPAISLLPETLSVLIAPEEMLARALNDNPHLCSSSVQDPLYHWHPRRPQPAGPQLDRADSKEGLHLRPSCGILEENHHPFLIVEHDPLLYGRARDIADRVAHHETGLSAIILLYASALDRHLEAMAEYEDRVFCFYGMQEKLGPEQGRGISEGKAGQTTWEAFS